jgi:hypothetical protein
MKKLFVLATLLAALASFGCGSDEPSANAPAKVPTSTTKSTKDVVKTEKLSDGSTVETTKSGSTITTRTDGKKVYSSGTGGPKIGQTKPGDTIHHFTK